MVPVRGCRRNVASRKSSVTPCSAKPPCKRSGRQSGDVRRLYTVEVNRFILNVVTGNADYGKVILAKWLWH